MMCLGWKQQSGCTVPVTHPGACPDITWFWVGLGVVAIGALSHAGKKKQGGNTGGGQAAA